MLFIKLVLLNLEALILLPIKPVGKLSLGVGSGFNFQTPCDSALSQFVCLAKICSSGFLPPSRREHECLKNHLFRNHGQLSKQCLKGIYPEEAPVSA